MIPSKILYLPVIKGEFIRDSEGKPRVYTNADAAIFGMKNKAFDEVRIYKLNHVMTRECFEDCDQMIHKIMEKNDV